jgi:hypothetical protein
MVMNMDRSRVDKNIITIVRYRSRVKHIEDARIKTAKAR